MDKKKLSNKRLLQSRYQTANVTALMGIIIMALALVISILGGEDIYILAFTLVGLATVMLGYIYKNRHVKCPNCKAPLVVVRGDSCPHCKEAFDKEESEIKE